MEVLLTFFSEAFWTSATLVAFLSTTITSAINAKLNPNKTWKQVIAWVVSILMTFVAYFLKIITVTEPTLVSLILLGIFVGLSSNGIYDIPFMKSTINGWFTFLKDNKVNK